MFVRQNYRQKPSFTLSYTYEVSAGSILALRRFPALLSFMVHLTIRLTENFHIFFLAKNLDIYTSESGFHELYRIIERLFLRFVKTQSLSILNMDCAHDWI